ncbi:MAG: hypothetical protein ACXU8P_14595 [Phenylobacterium sp.]
MLEQLAEAFSDAAIPQKVVMLALVPALPGALAVAVKDLRRPPGAARPSIFLSELRVAGPALGLLVGALEALHVAQTIRRLPQAATSKDLAPAIIEIAVLVALGALAGLLAAALHGMAARRARP